MENSSEMLKRAKLYLNDEIISQFQQYGVIHLKKVLTKNELELLELGITANLASPSPNFRKASDEADSGLFVEDFCCWQRFFQYKQFIFQSPLSAIASLLMQSTESRLYHDHMLVKEAFTQQITPWHQDQPYYNITGMQNCSFWIPIDHVSRESSLEFVLGSHRDKWYLPKTFKDNIAKWFPEGSLPEVPNIEQDRTKYSIRAWEMDPGDIICFHMLTLHSSKGVSTNTRRRAYSVRFVGDDVRFVHRAWVTSPPFHGLQEDLKDGAVLEHPLFPILWKSFSEIDSS